HINMKRIYLILLFLISLSGYSQSQVLATFEGKVFNKKERVSGAVILFVHTSHKATTGPSGYFKLPNIVPGKYLVSVTTEGFPDFLEEISLTAGNNYREFKLDELSHQLKEVIVTAEKRETNIQQTPSSISALESKAISDAKIWDIKDLSAIVPNLYAANPGDLRNVV